MGIIGEVLLIVIEIRTQAVVVVEHGCDTVEPETIEMVFLHPELQVGQQEVDHAGLAVVKALGTPGRMVTLIAVVEELPDGAVKHIDAFGCILDGMGMDHIQQHPNAHLMGLVDQVFQILRPAEPAGGRIEIGHLIAKRTVVGVLHDGHQLDGIITGLLHMGQGIIRKLPVGANLTLFLCHAHMGLVDVQTVLALERAVGPVEGIPVVGDLGSKGDGLGILHHTPGIERNMLRSGQVGIHHGLDLAAFP